MAEKRKSEFKCSHKTWRSLEFGDEIWGESFELDMPFKLGQNLFSDFKNELLL